MFAADPDLISTFMARAVLYFLHPAPGVAHRVGKSPAHQTRFEGTRRVHLPHAFVHAPKWQLRPLADSQLEQSLIACPGDFWPCARYRSAGCEQSAEGLSSERS